MKWTSDGLQKAAQKQIKLKKISTVILSLGGSRREGIKYDRVQD